MSLRLGALQDALLSAGADAEKAGQAAEELAAYETRFAHVERDLAVLKVMVGINIALSTGILIRLFML